MSRYSSILFLFLSFSSTAFAQSEKERISNFKLHPVYIDTLNEYILVVHKRYAVIYFKQSDIHDIVSYQDKFGLPSAEKYILIKAILRAKKKRVDYNDWFAEYTDEEKQSQWLFDYNGFDHMVMPEIWYIGYNLIKDGKFMLIEKDTGAINCDSLKIIDNTGISGIHTIQFNLPSGFSFWKELCLFGE